MDVEKTIEFLLTETARHDQQIGQVTGLVQTLVESQIRTDERIRETDERIRKQDENLRERFQETDERIRKLVSAIGTLASK